MSLETDFIVIGSGIAGLRAGVEIARGGGRVTVLTKERTSESNTEYAQGASRSRSPRTMKSASTSRTRSAPGRDCATSAQSKS